MALFVCVCVFGITEMYLINNIMQKNYQKGIKTANCMFGLCFKQVKSLWRENLNSRYIIWKHVSKWLASLVIIYLRKFGNVSMAICIRKLHAEEAINNHLKKDKLWENTGWEIRLLLTWIYKVNSARFQWPYLMPNKPSWIFLWILWFACLLNWICI